MKDVETRQQVGETIIAIIALSTVKACITDNNNQYNQYNFR